MTWTDEPLLQRNVVELVHEYLATEGLEGARAVDATAGNGHDSVFLARSVGATGEVVSVDIQSEAVSASKNRLRSLDLLDRVTVILGDHQHLSQLVPASWCGTTKVVLFNLGYLPGFLPGGERVLHTRADSSVAAASEAFELLAPGGLLVLTVYTGHQEGVSEAEALETWAREVAGANVTHVRDPGHRVSHDGLSSDQVPQDSSERGQSRPEVLIMRRSS